MKLYKSLVLSLMILTVSNNIQIREVNASTEGINYDVDMNGKIGEWDTTQEGIFDGWTGEIEGDIPQEGEYYTISVTVPLNMEFYVLSNSSLHGQFYSPEYAITNKGSKDLKVSVLPLSTGITEDGIIPLYVEPIVPKDERLQIELQLKELMKTDDSSVTGSDNEVEFTEIPNARTAYGNVINLFEADENTAKEDLVLFDSISAEEKKIFSFDAVNWELPERQYDQDGNAINTSAKSAFTTSLLFEVISN